MMAQTWILQIELGKSEPKFQKSRRGLTGCIHAHWCVGKAARCCQTFIHHRQIPPPTTTLLSANPLSYSTLSNFMLSDPMLSDLLWWFWNSLTPMISSKHPSIINNFNFFYVRLPIVVILICFIRYSFRLPPHSSHNWVVELRLALAAAKNASAQQLQEFSLQHCRHSNSRKCVVHQGCTSIAACRLRFSCSARRVDAVTGRKLLTVWRWSHGRTGAQCGRGFWHLEYAIHPLTRTLTQGIPHSKRTCHSHLEVEMPCTLQWYLLVMDRLAVWSGSDMALVTKKLQAMVKYVLRIFRGQLFFWVIILLLVWNCWIERNSASGFWTQEFWK